MCAVDKDLKREHAVDDVLLSTCTQHQLRLDIQLDLEGGGWKWICAQTCDCAIAFSKTVGFFCIVVEVAEGKRRRQVTRGQGIIDAFVKAD